MLTGRAIGLMLVVFARHACVAGICLMFPGDVNEATSFRIIREVAPLWAWAAMSLMIAVIMIAGIMTAKEILCRIALTLSAAVTAAWAAGFIMALVLFGIPPSPMLPIAWAALLAKDLIIAAGPLTRAATIASTQ